MRPVTFVSIILSIVTASVFAQSARVDELAIARAKLFRDHFALAADNTNSLLVQNMYMHVSSNVPEWIIHIEWCRNDGGQPPCTNRIPIPCALFGSGRHCMIDNARDSARVYESNPGAYPLACDRAYELAKACQCHNQEAEDAINRAGRDAVCSYLATH